MSDRPPNEPPDSPDDLLVSRALDGDVSSAEAAHVAADPRLAGRFDQMAMIRSRLGATVNDPEVTRRTASAVAYALDAGDRATVTTLDRRRLPVWLGAAAALAVVVAGAVVIGRGASDEQTPMTDGVVASDVADTGVGSASAAGSSAETMTAETTTTDGTTADGTTADGTTADPRAMPMTVVTVNLGSDDPATEPFPMPADDEVLQLDSTDELRWLGEWAAPLARTAGACRADTLVLLAQALFGLAGAAPVEVEVVTDTDGRRVLALALDGCDEIVSVALD